MHHMELKLEQVRPEDLDEVVGFLRRVFQAPPNAHFLQTDHVQWKFFEPRPDWDGSRSYVVREQSRIVAHACVVPTTFVTPDGTTIRTIFPIDWAADPALPGVGLALQKELGELVDVRVGHGGSAMARALERRGHARKHPYERIAGELIWARRSFRPWASLRDRTVPVWKTSARAARDVWRNMWRPLGATGEWVARPVERFDARLPDLRRQGNQTALTLPVRTPELLNYMLRCPSVRFSGFLLEKKNEVRGHFLLADHGQQIRLADLVIDSGVAEDWAACYALAFSTAKVCYRQGGCLSVMAAPADIQAALLRAGFQENRRSNVILQDRRSALPTDPLPVLNMMDNDAAYFS
jgi:hypothetical protein